LGTLRERSVLCERKCSHNEASQQMT
jgi:hypothetical protein